MPPYLPLYLYHPRTVCLLPKCNIFVCPTLSVYVECLQVFYVSRRVRCPKVGFTRHPGILGNPFTTLHGLPLVVATLMWHVESRTDFLNPLSIPTQNNKGLVCIILAFPIWSIVVWCNFSSIAMYQGNGTGTKTPTQHWQELFVK